MVKELKDHPTNCFFPNSKWVIEVHYKVFKGFPIGWGAKVKNGQMSSDGIQRLDSV